MDKPPLIKEIKRWLIKKNPLDLFKDKFAITDIDSKPWSGHFNYLVETPKRKLVLRFLGPEWGKPDGIINEFNILNKISGYRVGPAVYYSTQDFFSEPMIFEEYLVGKLFTELAPVKQQGSLVGIAKFIAKINSLPVTKNDFPFQEPMISYTKNKNTWRTRIEFILECHETKTCGQELLAFLPGVESILNKFESRLQRVIQQVGPVFIFESAHAGHLLKTVNGFRFFNWEQVSYGDPSYTLAVFLTSIHKQKDFLKVKDLMIKSYLEDKFISEFAELVEQRITERHISNSIWSIYMGVKKKATLIGNWQKKLHTIEKIIKDYS